MFFSYQLSIIYLILDLIEPMSPHAKSEDLRASSAMLGEKGGSWLGKPEPQREMPKSDGTQKKTAQMKGRRAHTCDTSCPATERMVSTGVCTYNK